MDHIEVTKLAHRYAQNALQAVWKLFQEDFQTIVVEKDDGKDIKLQADFKLHHYISESLGSSGWDILSEEDPIQKTRDKNKTYWVIDPLDGSFNFSRGFPAYASSIALMVDDQPVYGAILDLQEGSILSGGIFMQTNRNSKQVQLGSVTSLNQAVLATGFPLEFDFSEASAEIFKLYSQFKKIRMIGSAVSSLSYVASGTFDLYYEKDIYLWDVAAGLAIIKGAGGSYKWKRSEDSWKVTVVAGNSTLVELINI